MALSDRAALALVPTVLDISGVRDVEDTYMSVHGRGLVSSLVPSPSHERGESVENEQGCPFLVGLMNPVFQMTEIVVLFESDHPSLSTDTSLRIVPLVVSRPKPFPLWVSTVGCRNSAYSKPPDPGTSSPGSSIVLTPSSVSLGDVGLWTVAFDQRSRVM